MLLVGTAEPKLSMVVIGIRVEELRRRCVDLSFPKGDEGVRGGRADLGEAVWGGRVHRG